MANLHEQLKIRKSYVRLAASLLLGGLVTTAWDVFQKGWWPRSVGWLAAVVLMTGALFLVMRGRVIPD
jgi:hypothetical protein